MSRKTAREVAMKLAFASLFGVLATTTGTFNDTPALDALKASCGAPISMGRGEIPVRLAATSRLFCLRFFLR